MLLVKPYASFMHVLYVAANGYAGAQRAHICLAQMLWQLTGMLLVQPHVREENPSEARLAVLLWNNPNCR